MKLTDEIRSSSASFWLFAVCSFLLGAVIGFLFAPIKKGVRIGCDNTITNTECANGYGDKSDERTKKNNKKIEDIDIKL